MNLRRARASCDSSRPDAWVVRCVSAQMYADTHTHTRCRCPTIDICENRNKCIKKRSGSLGVPVLRLSGCRQSKRKKRGTAVVVLFLLLTGTFVYTFVYVYIMTQFSDCGAIELLIINRCTRIHTLCLSN